MAESNSNKSASANTSDASNAAACLEALSFSPPPKKLSNAPSVSAASTSTASTSKPSSWSNALTDMIPKKGVPFSEQDGTMHSATLQPSISTEEPSPVPSANDTVTDPGKDLIERKPGVEDMIPPNTTVPDQFAPSSPSVETKPSASDSTLVPSSLAEVVAVSMPPSSDPEPSPPVEQSAEMPAPCPSTDDAIPGTSPAVTPNVLSQPVPTIDAKPPASVPTSDLDTPALMIAAVGDEPTPEDMFEPLVSGGESPNSVTSAASTLNDIMPATSDDGHRLIPPPDNSQVPRVGDGGPPATVSIAPTLSSQTHPSSPASTLGESTLTTYTTPATFANSRSRARKEDGGSVDAAVWTELENDGVSLKSDDLGAIGTPNLEESPETPVRKATLAEIQRDTARTLRKQKEDYEQHQRFHDLKRHMDNQFEETNNIVTSGFTKTQAGLQQNSGKLDQSLAIAGEHTGLLQLITDSIALLFAQQEQHRGEKADVSNESAAISLARELYKSGFQGGTNEEIEEAIFNLNSSERLSLVQRHLEMMKMAKPEKPVSNVTHDGRREASVKTSDETLDAAPADDSATVFSSTIASHENRPPVASGRCGAGKGTGNENATISSMRNGSKQIVGPPPRSVLSQSTNKFQRRTCESLRPYSKKNQSKPSKFDTIQEKLFAGDDEWQLHVEGCNSLDMAMNDIEIDDKSIRHFLLVRGGKRVVLKRIAELLSMNRTERKVACLSVLGNFINKLKTAAATEAGHDATAIIISPLLKICGDRETSFVPELAMEKLLLLVDVAKHHNYYLPIHVLLNDWLRLSPSMLQCEKRMGRYAAALLGYTHDLNLTEDGRLGLLKAEENIIKAVRTCIHHKAASVREIGAQIFCAMDAHSDLCYLAESLYKNLKDGDVKKRLRSAKLNVEKNIYNN